MPAHAFILPSGGMDANTAPIPLVPAIATKYHPYPHPRMRAGAQSKELGCVDAHMVDLDTLALQRKT
jgi:hypothetical protein